MLSWFRRVGHRLRGGGWHPETFVCSRRRHVLPAASVVHLRPQDGGVGFDLQDGRRFARCLRCDAWKEVPHPVEGAAPAETLPPLADIALPRRGEELREAIVLRVIAIDRSVHVVVFGLLFVIALLIRLNIGPLHDQARTILDALQTGAANTSQGGSQGFIVTELERAANVRTGTVDVLMFTALAYFVLELIEAIGLWHERRWAEYLTAVATSGLLPFEIIELTKRVTMIRVGALAINLAIVIWLVWRKRLFGVNGGRVAGGHEAPDPEVLLAPPTGP